MGVAVDETGRYVTSRSVENLRRFPARMFGAGTDVADASVDNRDLHAVEHLAGVNVDELAAADNQIGFDLPHGAADESCQLLL